MRSHLVLGLLAIVPVVATAQVVPQGSSPDTVLRLLGSPRARTATKAREIWSYSNYQVVFENGQVTSLTGLPTEGGSVEWRKRTLDVTSPPQGVAPGQKVPSGTLSASPAASSIANPPDPRTKAPAPVLASSAPGKIALNSPDRRTLPARNEAGWWSRTWPYMLLAGVMAGGLWWAVVNVRKWLIATFRFLRRKAAIPTQKRPADVAPAAAEGIDPYRTSEKGVTKTPTLADWELTMELFRSLEWKRVELLVQRFYAASGFQTKAVGVGADDGADIYLFRAGSLKPLGYVQCRPWGDRRIDQVQVRVLFGIMAAQKIPEGTVVTTGDFDPEARTFGRQNRLNLISGDDFLARFNRLPVMMRARILGEVTAGDYTTPSCPRCGVKLVLSATDTQTAPVWTCQRFPTCRYTMETAGETIPVAYSGRKG